MQNTATRYLKIALLTGLGLLVSLHVFAANPDEKAVQHSYQTWCQTIGTAKGDAGQVVRLYAPHAILLPTLSPEILVNEHNGLNSYFASLTAREKIKCTPQRLVTQLFGDMAINSGTYTFSYIDYGKHLKKIPARFSFVYHKSGDQWLIVNHHSSMLPQ